MGQENKQTRITTNKNDCDFNQGQKLKRGKKKKTVRKEKQERM